MTIQTIITDLKKSGRNSKLKVIKKLEKPTLEELLELRRDINEKICKEKGEGMQFEVKGKICGKGRPRFVRRGQFVQTYTPDVTANYENLIKLSFINARGEIINKPKGVLISIIAGFTPPTSVSKKKQIECLDNKIKCIKKPDIDNITKVVMDALNKIAYEDDSQVVEINVRKVYHEQEMLVVQIEEAV